MHDGCNGSFDDGKQVLEKVRMMGFSTGILPVPAQFYCECGDELLMDTFEYKCPNCGMVYAVTPCHAFEVDNIQAAGKDV